MSHYDDEVSELRKLIYEVEAIQRKNAYQAALEKARREGKNPLNGLLFNPLIRIATRLSLGFENTIKKGVNKTLDAIDRLFNIHP